MLPDLSSVGFYYSSHPEGDYQVLNIAIESDQVTLELRELATPNLAALKSLLQDFCKDCNLEFVALG